MHYHSVPYFSDREWAAMSQITDKTQELALLLLPVFFVLRLSYDYAQGLLGDELTLRVLLKGLYVCVGLLLLLVSYPQLLERLDHVVSLVTTTLNDEQLVEQMLEQLQAQLDGPDQEESPWYFSIIPSLMNFLKRVVIEWGIPFLRTFLICLRGYLLIFSTQVGPLAIAFSILPGKCGGAFASWLSMHLSLLCWGITMGLLDISLAITSCNAAFTIEACVRDWIAAVAFGVMYMLLAPLTSMYMGQMVSDGLFSKTTSALGSKLLRAL